MKKFTLCLIFLLISISLFAAPFGLSMGMSLNLVKITCGGREPVLIKDGIYRIVPAKQHPYFENYYAWIDPVKGLNYIKAIGKDIETSSYGIDVKSKFSYLEDGISKTYGKCQRTDYLMYDSIWDEPRDWMSALKNDDRYLFSIWDASTNATLKDSITSIFLSAEAEDSNTGYIILEYEFKNHDEVQKEKESKDLEAF